MFAFIKTPTKAEASKSAIETTSSNPASVEAMETLTAKEAEAVSGGLYAEGSTPFPFHLASYPGHVDPRTAR